MWSVQDFLGVVSEIVRSGLPLTHHQARQFLDDYPLSYIFEICQRENTTGLHIRNICGALDRVLSTSYGTEILSQISPYAIAALSSRHVELRKLGVRQISKSLAECPTSDGSIFLGPLLLALQDTELEVAAGVLSAVESLVAVPHNFELLLTEHLSTIAQLAGSETDVVRLRAFQLLLYAAARSEENHQKIELAGLLNPLLKELDNYPDPLACLSAWHLFGELVRKWSEAGEEGSAQVISGVCRVLRPRILGMLGESDDQSLLSGMLAVAGPVLGAALEAEGPGEGAAAELFSPFVEYLNGVLKSDKSFEREMLSPVLDTVGQIGATRSGADNIIQSSTEILKGVVSYAFTPSSPEEILTSALHSIATLAGSEWSGRGEETCSKESESKLESVVFSCCAENGGASPGEVFWDLLQNPVTQQRVAVYRAMTFLGVRLWAAGSLCSHVPLFHHLTDGIEPKRDVAEWRFACLQKIAATARNGCQPDLVNPHQAILQSCLPKLESAVSKGPFLRSRTTTTEAIPVVATEMR
ncbi:hypothetical protein BSKO_07433 [Bryopsis sp. KO-2023]|nr:hypothetical protein BSKO_07433 [Bryopsis sp. KO-2023]